ncbi:MAG: NHLP bacteriocin system secretion protein [Pseudomonadota bacterium]
MAAQKTIFRQEALKKQLNDESLITAVHTIQYKWWLTLVTLTIIVLAVLLWSIFGSVATRVEGKGILLNSSGQLYQADTVDAEGQITAIKVTLGQTVKKGQQIATLENIGLNKQLEASKNYLTKLQAQYDHYQTQFQQELFERQQRLTRQNNLLGEIIETENEHLSHAQKLFDDLVEAQKRGTVTRLQLINAQQDYYGTQREIAHAKQRIIDNEMAEQTFEDSWQQRLRDLQLRIKEAELDFENLQQKVNLSKQIVSPVDGTIIAISGVVGSHIMPGDAVATIASSGHGLDALLFVLPRDGKQVKSKMEALIVPENVKREEYGSIRGEVIDLSDYPMSQQAMQALFHNETLIKHFINNNAPPIMIRIKLRQDSSTPSGLQWTSSQGVSDVITPGTLVNGWITVRHQAPITLLIPTLKKLFGINT